jgi:hypothetical protein
MQLFLFGQQLLNGFPVHLIGHTAVYRTYRRTLGLFMETLAFGAFIGDNIIGIDTNGGIAFGGLDYGTVEKGKGAFDAGAVGDRPFHTAFINSIIGAFRFTGPAIDTFFCYLNSHVLNIRRLMN